MWRNVFLLEFSRMIRLLALFPSVVSLTTLFSVACRRNRSTDETKKAGDYMTETVTCEGCLLQIEPHRCTRTFIGGRWHYFCPSCERNGEAGIVVRRLLKDERKKKSGAE